MRREQGFALLIVLWTLVFLSFLMTQIISTGRTAISLADTIRGAAQARAAADGAINEALFHVIAKGADHWAPDGRPHDLSKSGMVISVQIYSLAGKINPNIASTALLAGLLQAVGASPVQAEQLAGAINQWRSHAATKQDEADRIAAYKHAGLPYAPPGHSFADLSELAYVIGMPPSLLAEALPEMSLYPSDNPDPTQADPVVRRARTLAGQTPSGTEAYNGTVPIVLIEAQAATPNGTMASLRAIASLVISDPRMPFQILSLNRR